MNTPVPIPPTYTSFYKKYQQLLHTSYPSTIKYPFPPVSPFVIYIPQKIINQIKTIIKLLYRTSHLKEYIASIQTTQRDLKKIAHSANSSVLMCYDFHYTKNYGLKLIEVNTNAGSYLTVELANQIHQKKTNALSNLKQSFTEELKKWQTTMIKPLAYTKPSIKHPLRVLIVDHKIPSQKLYTEFFMYKDLMSEWGWDCQLQEAYQLKTNTDGYIINAQNKKVDIIYNRYTKDFYLNDFPVLKQAFLSKTCCITPSPIEYLLLSDKQRMCEWSFEPFLNQLPISKKEKNLILKTVPRTKLISETPIQTLWQNRKQFFFKPLRGCGGQAVYSGKTITKKLLYQLQAQLGVYQNEIPAGVFTDPQGVKWNYDLRAYSYKGVLQQLAARVYQGEKANVSYSPPSGMASVLPKAQAKN